VAERPFAWKSRFRRLVSDYECLSTTLAGLHRVAFICLAIARAAPVLPLVHYSSWPVNALKGRM
jgi:hypothetical protein